MSEQQIDLSWEEIAELAKQTIEVHQSTIAQQQARIEALEKEVFVQKGLVTVARLLTDKAEQALAAERERADRAEQLAKDHLVTAGAWMEKSAKDEAELYDERDRAEKAERERGNFYIDWGIANGSLKEALKELQAEREKHMTTATMMVAATEKLVDTQDELAAEREHVTEIEEDYARLNAAVVKAHAEAAAERERADFWSGMHDARMADLNRLGEELQAEREKSAQ